MERRAALADMTEGLAWLAQAVLVEAAFANGKIADAGELLEERNGSVPPATTAWFALLQPVRVHLFGGELAEALTACESVLALDPPRQPRSFTALTHAFLALIAAYQDDASALESHVAAVKEWWVFRLPGLTAGRTWWRGSRLRPPATTLALDPWSCRGRRAAFISLKWWIARWATTSWRAPP